MRVAVTTGKKNTSVAGMEDNMVDWSKAPDWAKYHAFDSKGELGKGYWYAGYPFKVKENGEGVYWSVEQNEKSGYEIPPGMDWEDSIEKRPEKL